MATQTTLSSLSQSESTTQTAPAAEVESRGSQWPEFELNFEGEAWKVELDHPYSVTDLRMDVSHETADQSSLNATDIPAPLPQQTSTPVKSIDSSDEAMDDSRRDPDFQPPSDGVPSDTSSDFEGEDLDGQQTYVHDRKFVVFEKNLDQLLWNLRCQTPGCTAPIISVDKNQPVGMLLHVKVTCLNGHASYDWESMPRVGDMPAGHLIGSAALLFSGNQFASLCAMAEFMNLAFISKSCYYSIQKTYLVPVVMSFWQEEQEAITDDILHRVDAGETIKIAGDGQCDSPGFSAKYCTYSLMDQKSGKIVTFNVKQVSECTSSVAMETDAFVDCISFMAEKGIYIDVFSSDRHRSVGAAIKRELSQLIGDHQYDIFHISKSFQKDLARRAKAKGCEALKHWAPGMNLHLWWACATCDGDADMLVEKFKASVFHASGCHEFPHFRHFKRCAHPIPLPDGQQRMYLEEGSPAHNSLGKAVNKPTLLSDLRKCTQFCHTGQLESYHSLRLKYCPKRSHFSIDVMEARGALAALDHNFNVGREQAVVNRPSAASDAAGALRFAPYHSKRTKRWSARPLLEAKQYGYVYEMMERVVAKKASGDTTLYASRDVARSIARTPCPGKAQLVAHHINRMEMAQ